MLEFPHLGVHWQFPLLKCLLLGFRIYLRQDWFRKYRVALNWVRAGSECKEEAGSYDVDLHICDLNKQGIIRIKGIQTIRSLQQHFFLSSSILVLLKSKL